MANHATRDCRGCTGRIVASGLVVLRRSNHETSRSGHRFWRHRRARSARSHGAAAFRTRRDRCLAPSVGTERYVVDLARQSLLAKARQRPDHVKRVMQKIRQEGLAQTVTQVRGKLDEPMPLGYSASGTVIACGREVQSIKPGDRVAVAAPHASIVTIGQNLCAVVPPGRLTSRARRTRASPRSRCRACGWRSSRSANGSSSSASA